MPPDGSTRVRPLVVPIHRFLVRSSNSTETWSSLMVPGSVAMNRWRTSFPVAGSISMTPSLSLPIHTLPLDAATTAVIDAPLRPWSFWSAGRMVAPVSGFQRITPSLAVPSHRLPAASMSNAVIVTSSGLVKNFVNVPVAGSKRFSPPPLIASQTRPLRSRTIDVTPSEVTAALPVPCVNRVN